MNNSSDYLLNGDENESAYAWVSEGFAYEDSGCFEKAADCYLKGAKLGNIPAMHNLGIAYFIGGEYGARNISEAQKWLELAAEMGHTVSMSMLGYINYYIFSAESLKKSLKWLNLAAQNGDCDAMLFLARNFYLSGDYRLSDYYNESSGISILKKAADLGDESAMLLLSQYHSCDCEEWLRRYSRAKMGFLQI